MDFKIKFINGFNIVLLGLTTLFLIGFAYDSVGYQYSVIMLTICVLLTIYILYKKQNGFLLVYLLYLFLTNIGIYFTNVFVDNPFTEYHGDLSWYYSDFKLVFVIAMSGVLLFTILSTILSTIPKNLNNSKINITNKGNPTFFYAGIFFVVAFTILFLYYIASGKLSITTYGDFVSSIQELPFYTYGVFIFSLGVSFIYANVQKKNLVKISLILLPQVFLFFITGNRGEVFFPLLSAFGVLIVRGFKVKWWLNLSILLILFIIIPLIKVSRNIQNFSFSDLNINWFSSIVEIGYTLRPLGFIALWIDSGEKLAYGESYFAPIQRFFSRFIPSIEPINYEIAGYGFRYRMPGMGMNVLGEAFYNGAWLALILVVSIIVFMCWIFSRSTSYIKLSIATGIVSILINNIRNAFSFVPGYIILVLSIALFLIVINEYFSKASRNDYDEK